MINQTICSKVFKISPANHFIENVLRQTMLQSSAIKNYSPSSLKIIKLLGCGNYATTKLYYHKDTKKHVAGKTFSISGDIQTIISQRKEAAKREAKILTRIKHENIARVLGTTV